MSADDFLKFASKPIGSENCTHYSSLLLLCNIDLLSLFPATYNCILIFHPFANHAKKFHVKHSISYSFKTFSFSMALVR